jgi:hypothetical protein
MSRWYSRRFRASGVSVNRVGSQSYPTLIKLVRTTAADSGEGSGNGPAYVSGPVTVVGDDIYGLDNNGNGVGCE